MKDTDRSLLRLRFRPEIGDDGILENGKDIRLPIPPPDWDRGLDLLKRINQLKDSSGRRLSSLVKVDGFEPWWYSQDRLLRFYLVPLTQYFPLLQLANSFQEVEIEEAPPDLRRLMDAIGPPFRRSPLKRESAAGRLLQKMLSLLSLLLFRISGCDTVLYIVDHVSPGSREDFRFAPLYRELSRRGYRIAEYAHTLSPRQALGNFLRRRRPVFFLEATDSNQNDCAREKRSAHEEGESQALWSLVPTVLDWCVQSTARQRYLLSALKFQKARRAVIFDDNRHNHELVAACRTLAIPVLGFQHGVFNRFHAGLMAFGFSDARTHAFDRYGVWSGLFRDRLLADSTLYNPENVFISGPLRPPEGMPPDRQPVPSGQALRVLVVSEPLARKREVAPFLLALRSQPGIELFIKMRPGESAGGLAAYGLDAEKVVALTTGTVFEAFRQVDVVVGTYSSVIYEAALDLLPAVWMRTSRAYGSELAEEGLAEKAEDPSEIVCAVRRAAAMPAEERRLRRERIWGRNFSAGAASILNLAEAELWSR